MTIDLSAAEARRVRLSSHLLAASDLAPTEVVARAIALQGQDLPAVLRAIAIRSSPGTTVADVRAAFDRGELVRSWPMRGTLFATTPDHLAALLHFTGERTINSMAKRRAELGLDDVVVERARALVVEALATRPLRRAEVLELWQQAGIQTDGGPGYHLIVNLAASGLVHWGAFDETGAEQLLTLSTAAPPADADAALTTVVRGFVAARGPVTEADLAWWTKLPKTLLRRALPLIDDLVELTVEGAPAWVIGEMLDADARAGSDADTGSDAGAAPADGAGPAGYGDVTLVPAFDEWILGYGERSLVASREMLAAVVPGNNGVFRPTVLVDGVVVGTWRVVRARGGSTAEITALVEKVSASTQRKIDAALAAWPHA